MFSINLHAPDLEQDLAELQALNGFAADFGRIEQQARDIVFEENRVARLAGVDVDDDSLIPITIGTVESRRRRGDGDGPPLAPNRDSSRVIRNFVATSDAAPGRLTVSGGWVGMPWLAAHARGAGHLPVRDVMSSIQPKALARLDTLVAEEADRQVAEALAKPRGAFARIASFFGRR